VRAVLLPGLDGTGRLFDRFCAAAPSGWQLSPTSYPADVPLGYDELAVALPAEPFVLIAESFSGPLALRIAAQRPAGLAAVVLVATFVTPPAPRALGALPWTLLFRAAPPLAALRFFFCGGDDALARAMRDSVASVVPEVLAHRLRCVLGCDARGDLAACAAPVLYLAARDDRVVPRRAGEQITALQPSVTMARVPGPHLLLQANPAGAWREIAAFLAA
jgi:pimeloyl-[acyl-carrier protein] methyl ester esterase